MKAYAIETIKNQLEENKTYKKEDIVEILKNTEPDFDFERIKNRIRNFSGIVSQNTLEEILSVIKETKQKSFYD